MRCPVCGFEIDKKTIKCPDCNFDKFQSEFLNLPEYENWMLETAVPWRDAFVDKLLSQAKSCTELTRNWTMKAEKLFDNGNKIPESHFVKTNALFELCDASLNGIETMTIDWIVKGTTTINYIEHLGTLDCLDNIAYTFDFTKENVVIKYIRRTNTMLMYGTYDNINVKSKDYLRMLFETSKIHKLESTYKDEVIDDGAYWEMNIQLRYPVIKSFMSDKSCWKYSERDEFAETSKIEQWRWTDVETNYLLECCGKFNKMHEKIILTTLLGEYIKEPPRNLKVLKYDKIDTADVW